MRVLVMPGLTLPEVSEAQLETIRAAAGPDADVVVANNREDAMEMIADAEVLLGYLTPELFAEAKELKWVHATASGVDGYLFDDFKNADIPLTGEKGLVGPHLADHAFALLLALARSLKPAMTLRGEAWGGRVPMRRAAFELSGLTMGIVGFGGTGRAISERANGFGMNVRAVDAIAVRGTPIVPVVGHMNQLDTLLEKSDVVAVCTPLTAETRHLFNAETFAKMKPGSVIVNVTRGEIIELEALIDAVESGHLRGAALDVVGGRAAADGSPRFRDREHRDDTAHGGRIAAPSRPQPRAFLRELAPLSRQSRTRRRGRQAGRVLAANNHPDPFP